MLETPELEGKKCPCRHEIFDDVRAGVALSATALDILPKSSVVILPQSTTFGECHISFIAPEKSGKESDVSIITISRAPCRRKSKNSHRTEMSLCQAHIDSDTSESITLRFERSTKHSWIVV